ncbi:MAG: hypothetical protein JW932_17880 [Deltaproteobacteria bacterium]|nr:hypothetical protein [Deltaproteobacteria bacterium]
MNHMPVRMYTLYHHLNHRIMDLPYLHMPTIFFKIIMESWSRKRPRNTCLCHSGEDGDFEGKVQAIETIDTFIPIVANIAKDVLVITGDHSTPSRMGSHSWHPVPVMIRAPSAWADEVRAFNENTCRQGYLGLRPGLHLMGLALAHAGRLRKYGA